MKKKRRIRRLESRVHELERQMRAVTRQLDPAFDGRTLPELSAAQGGYVPTTTTKSGATVTWTQGPPFIINMDGVSVADVNSCIDDSHGRLLQAIQGN